MTLALLIVLLIAALVQIAALVVAAIRGRRPRGLESHLGQRVALTNAQDQTFRGTLTQVHARHVTLVDAQFLSSEGPTKMDGSIILERPLSSWQILAPPVESS